MMLAFAGVGSALLLSGRRPRRPATRRQIEKSSEDADSARPVRTALLAGLACGVLCLVLFGPRGVIWACAVAPGAYVIVKRLASRSGAQRPREEQRSVPIVLDLLAAAVSAGAPLPMAMACVAEGVNGRTGTQLLRAAALLRLGATPEEAWFDLRSDAVLAPLAAVAVRSATSGIRLADGLSRQAETVREQLVTGDTARAERVGVAALLPLGLCFLPAFVCLGIVPIVVGIAGDAFGRLGT